MGAFNVLRASVPCPACESVEPVAIQFKHGDTSQHEYELGDALRWGGNDFGPRGAPHVVVDGIVASPCARCGDDRERMVEIHVEDDRLISVEVVAPTRL